jgi:hypothetical protein
MRREVEDDMALYRLVEKMFLRVDDELEARICEAGSEIEFSGIPHRNMLPLDDEARAAIEAIPPLNTMAKNVAPRRGDPPSSA